MEEFRVCQVCGYGRGFHVCFRAEADGVSLGLICPNCGQSYNPGWKEKDVSLPLMPEQEEVFAEKE